MDPGLTQCPSIMHEELKARARFRKGQYVRYEGTAYLVNERYYRRSQDRFVYDLEKVTMGQLRAPKLRKVAEEDIEAS